MKSINIFIVNDDEYSGLLNTALQELDAFGLVREKDYTVFGVPPSFVEYYSPIMFKVNLDESNKTNMETFFGKEGLDYLIDMLREAA